MLEAIDNNPYICSEHIAIFYGVAMLWLIYFHKAQIFQMKFTRFLIYQGVTLGMSPQDLDRKIDDANSSYATDMVHGAPSPHH